MSKLMNTIVFGLAVSGAALLTSGCDATHELEPSVAALRLAEQQPPPVSDDSALAAAVARHGRPTAPSAAPSTAVELAAAVEPAPPPPRRTFVVSIPTGLGDDALTSYLRRTGLTAVHRYDDLVRVEAGDAVDLAAIRDRVSGEGVVGLREAVE